MQREGRTVKVRPFFAVCRLYLAFGVELVTVFEQCEGNDSVNLICAR